jgi:hypothetical protein
VLRGTNLRVVAAPLVPDSSGSATKSDPVTKVPINGLLPDSSTVTAVPAGHEVPGAPGTRQVNVFVVVPTLTSTDWVVEAMVMAASNVPVYHFILPLITLAKDEPTSANNPTTTVNAFFI